VTTKHKPINGWTKAKMLERIREFVPNTKDGCVDPEKCGGCVYKKDKHRCAVGAFFSDEEAEKWATDSRGVLGLAEDNRELFDTLPLSPHILRSLQLAHDTWSENATARQRCIDWIDANVEED
jgi:hypothetical protein